MSTHGPDTGSRVLVESARRRAAALEIEDKPGVRASPELVARIVAGLSLARLRGDVVRLNLGEGGVKEYREGDLELLLVQAAEGFERFDSVGLKGQGQTSEALSRG